MENKIDFPETVMLIDAVLLDFIIKDFKKNFEEMLHRPLQEMGVSQFIINLALEANIPIGNKEVQVIFVYDESTPKLSHSTPSDLNTELNGVAFRDSRGEFIFSSLSTEGMATHHELFFNLLNLIGESPKVKRVIAVPFEQNSNEIIHAALEKMRKKEVTLFDMTKPERPTSYTWRMLAYPVMQALGIRGDELPD